MPSDSEVRLPASHPVVGVYLKGVQFSYPGFENLSCPEEENNPSETAMSPVKNRKLSFAGFH